MARLEAILKSLHDDKSKVVIDLSCRRHDGKWVVAMNKWQTLTDMELNQGWFIEITPMDPL
jgi:phosphoribosylformimino-5-aminoimidazole carboxamide ribotide isomerase